jgi:hypothetical protein
MMVAATSRVEGCMTIGADGVGLDIGGDGEFGATGSAEDRLVVPFGLGPGFERMAGKGVVAVFASVVEPATFHFDGDDVEGGAVVEAAGLRVEVEAVDLRVEWGHR